ncbi:MAG: 2-dehydropantoate 2-reductase [Arsenophonus sp.]|nr:MAG: 2-dehydropantoate 2-reductase [Arsenophonus sp.]
MINISILGCGALGSVFLKLLIDNGKNISVHGITKNSNNKRLEVNIVDINQIEKKYFITTNLISSIRNTHILIITLKAWKIYPELLKISKIVNQNCIIIMIFNGMVNEKCFLKIKQPLIRGVTNHAAYKENNIIYHVHNGEIIIGGINNLGKKSYFVLDMLSNFLGKVRWHSNIIIPTLEKLCINSVINPLSVKYQCKNKELNKYKKEIFYLCLELDLVIKKTFFHNFGVEYLYKKILNIIKLTGNNKSSMLQDIECNKKTEIQEITGYLLNISKKNNIHIPRHEELYVLVSKELSF